MSKNAYDFTVFIGRLNPPHKQHILAIHQGLELANNIIIVLGSYRIARNIRNPFTVDEREAMIRSCFTSEENKRIIVKTVRDYHYNDNNWVADVQQKVSQTVGTLSDICLLGLHKDHTSYYLDLFPQWKREHIKNNKVLNATDVRNILFDRAVLNKLDYLREMCDEQVVQHLDHWRHTNPDKFKSLCDEWTFIQEYKKQWASAPYPVTFTTTDAIVVKSGHVLVIKRKFNPGKGLLALPGGFLQQNKTLFESALSELKEETRIMMSKDEISKYLKDHREFDHPGRSLRGRTVTHAYYFELPSGGDLPRVKGDDDAEHAMWLPINEAFANEELFYEDHLQIIQYFYGRGNR